MEPIRTVPRSVRLEMQRVKEIMDYLKDIDASQKKAALNERFTASYRRVGEPTLPAVLCLVLALTLTVVSVLIFSVS